MVEMARERGRSIGVDAADPRADVDEKTSANGGGQPAADLSDLEPCQYRHTETIPTGIAHTVFAEGTADRNAL
jgi:hypothetical protein